MSSHAVERERFQAMMESEGMDREISQRILRHAQTIQRLSEAECNGDWPCDNGERKVIQCGRCEASYVRSSMVRDHSIPRPICTDVAHSVGFGLICPNCRAQDLIQEWCVKATQKATHDVEIRDGFIAGQLRQFVPIFQGDPRGSCVKLKVPSGRTDDHAREGICVPTR